MYRSCHQRNIDRAYMPHIDLTYTYHQVTSKPPDNHQIDIEHYCQTTRLIKVDLICPAPSPNWYRWRISRRISILPPYTTRLVSILSALYQSNIDLKYPPPDYHQHHLHTAKQISILPANHHTGIAEYSQLFHGAPFQDKAAVTDDLDHLPGRVNQQTITVSHTDHCSAGDILTSHWYSRIQASKGVTTVASD